MRTAFGPNPNGAALSAPNVTGQRLGWCIRRQRHGISTIVGPGRIGIQ